MPGTTSTLPLFYFQARQDAAVWLHQVGLRREVGIVPTLLVGEVFLVDDRCRVTVIPDVRSLLQGFPAVHSSLLTAANPLHPCDARPARPSHPGSGKCSARCFETQAEHRLRLDCRAGNDTTSAIAEVLKVPQALVQLADPACDDIVRLHTSAAGQRAAAGLPPPESSRSNPLTILALEGQQTLARRDAVRREEAAARQRRRAAAGTPWWQPWRRASEQSEHPQPSNSNSSISARPAAEAPPLGPPRLSSMPWGMALSVLDRHPGQVVLQPDAQQVCVKLIALQSACPTTHFLHRFRIALMCKAARCTGAACGAAARCQAGQVPAGALQVGKPSLLGPERQPSHTHAAPSLTGHRQLVDHD